MADLLTHMASGVAVKAMTRGPYAAALIAGTVLPDLGARVPAMGLSALAKKGASIAPEWAYAFEVLHMPLGMILMSFVLAGLFHPDQRRAVFWNLLAGCGLHLLVDLTQSHMGVGYLLGFPLSTWDFELGWMGTEATVLWSPWFMLTAIVLWRWRRGRLGLRRASG